MDLHHLANLVDGGYLRSQRHPTLPLTIYNYTSKTQYERRWDVVTRSCRGLILDDSGEIVARPLERFPNWDEPDTHIPLSERFEVFEKLDGSLIIVTHHATYGMIVASRGSFTSDQARWATELLYEAHGESGTDATWLEPGVTYCLELIHPANRIVLDYGNRRELVLLAARWTGTGVEIPLNELDWMPFTLASRYPSAAIHELAAREDPNSEGFVLLFESGTRAKCKLAEYKRLHGLVTGVSEHAIWEMLAAGQSTDALFERVPDEFFAWARGVVSRLTAEYAFEQMRARLIVDRVRAFATRREQAAYILGHTPLPAAAFKVLDGRDPARAIWKTLEPAHNRPFWNREDSA